jgi:hypothetical protein
MTRIVFLLYESRSGSTLLSRMLDVFGDIGVTTESNFMVNLLSIDGRIRKGLPAGEILRHLGRDDRFAAMDIDEESIAETYLTMEPGVGSFTRAFLHAYFRRQKPDAEAWVVKDGANGRFVNRIHGELPDALFVHVLRDGRAVLSSQLRTRRPHARDELMATDPMEVGRSWRRFVKSVDRFAESNPRSVLEVRYEGLVQDSDAEIRRIRRFVGLDPSLPPRPGDTSYFDRLPAGEKDIHAMVERPPAPERVRSWERELAPDDRALFEIEAGRMLRLKGYDDVRGISALRWIERPSLMGRYVECQARRARQVGGMLRRPKELGRWLDMRCLHLLDRIEERRKTDREARS